MKLRQSFLQIAMIMLTGLMLGMSCAVVFAQPGVTGNPQTRFNEANAAYTKGDYAKAIGLYQQLLAERWQSGPLYYNLGNAYFKQGETGKAILYYEKAKRLIPGDADLKANLAHASGNANPGTPGWQTRLWEAIVFSCSLEQAWSATSVCLFLLAGILIVLILWPQGFAQLKPWPQAALAVTGCALMICLGIAVCTGIERSQPAAVAVQAGGEARFEPTAQAPLRFNLTEGSRVVIQEQRKGWSLVARRDGVKGWVQSSFLEKI